VQGGHDVEHVARQARRRAAPRSGVDNLDRTAGRS
jgi:hypothetical protein